MNRIFKVIICCCLFCNVSLAQAQVQGVFVSRLDSLLLTKSFVTDFRQWTNQNNINTIFVYNPYLIQDSKFSEIFHDFYESNKQLKWVAVVSTSKGYTELFADSVGFWDGYLLENEWWRAKSSFYTYNKELKICRAVRELPHYAYLGWLSSSNLIAQWQAKQIAKSSAYVMLHTYSEVFNPQIVRDRVKAFRKNAISILMLHSMQKKYAYQNLYQMDFEKVNMAYLKALNGTLKKPAKNVAGFVIFTYLDAVQN